MSGPMRKITYTVQKMDFDATRPWAVLHDRHWNRVIQRYETKEQAARRARDMNKKEASRDHS